MNSDTPANRAESPSSTKSPSEGCPHAKRYFNQYGQVVACACNQWSCDYCRKVLSWRWAQRIRYGIALRVDHDPWFWTLTLPAWVPDAARGFKILPSRWDALRKELQRKLPDFAYAAFIEGQPERGHMPHFHIITFQPAHRRLKDLAVHCGFGFEADQQQIDAGKAVSYVVKYANKQGPFVPRHFRRVRVSRAWPSLPAPEYAVKVYPLLQGESLSAYVQRMSVALGHSMAGLRALYLDRSGDLH